MLTRFPIAVQLRFLQTMREVASERNTTTFFPLPMDLIGPAARTRLGAEAPSARRRRELTRVERWLAQRLR